MNITFTLFTASVGQIIQRQKFHRQTAWARVSTAIRNHDFFSAKERALPPQPPKNSLKIIYADINGKKDW